MREIKETDYKPEIVIIITSSIMHVITFLVVVFGVVELYKLSSSWHSLWLILIMFFAKSVTFTRD